MGFTKSRNKNTNNVHEKPPESLDTALNLSGSVIGLGGGAVARAWDQGWQGNEVRGLVGRRPSSSLPL